MHQYCSTYTIFLQLMTKRLDPIHCFSSDVDVTPPQQPTTPLQSWQLFDKRIVSTSSLVLRGSSSHHGNTQHIQYLRYSERAHSGAHRGRFSGGLDLGRLARKPSCIRMCDGGKTSFDRHTSTRCLFRRTFRHESDFEIWSVGTSMV